MFRPGIPWRRVAPAHDVVAQPCCSRSNYGSMPVSWMSTPSSAAWRSSRRQSPTPESRAADSATARRCATYKIASMISPGRAWAAGRCPGRAGDARPAGTQPCKQASAPAHGGIKQGDDRLRLSCRLTATSSHSHNELVSRDPEDNGVSGLCGSRHSPWALAMLSRAIRQVVRSLDVPGLA